MDNPESVNVLFLRYLLFYSSPFSGYGVLAACSETLHLSGNAVHANRNIGVYVKQTTPVSIVDNSITCNTEDGLHLMPGSQVTEINEN